MQAAGAVAGFDADGFGQQHLAGVQARVHLHDGHAGGGVACLNGAVNRCRSAPARQQRSMNVQAAESGQVEQPLRQHQAIGGDHEHVGPRGLDGSACDQCIIGKFSILTQAARLGNGHIVLLRPLLDAGGVQGHAATGRAVRLGENEGEVKAFGMQPGQCHRGKFRRTGKNHAHGD